MRLLKRFCAIFLSVMLVMSLGIVTAFAAAKTGSLTLKDSHGNVMSNSTFDAYQIISWNSGNMAVNGTFKGIIKNALGITSSDDADIMRAIGNLRDKGTAAAKFAADVKAGILSMNPKAVTTAQSKDGKFSSLPYGYYLIVQTSVGEADGTALSDPILVFIDKAETEVKVKVSAANIEKKIEVPDPADSKNKIYVDSNTAAVGDKVNYRSLSTIPVYPDDATNITYKITDTLSDGLVFDSDTPINVDVVDVAKDGSITVVKNLKEATDYTISYKDNGQTFVISMNGANSDSNLIAWGKEGYRIRVTYSAILGKGAALANVNFGSTGNPNSVKLEYTANLSNIRETDYDTVITYTNKLVIVKTDTLGNRLKGAVFELYRNGVKVDTQTTGDDGIAVFDKIQQGHYVLTEVKAPAGYNKMNDIVFDVEAYNSGSLRIPNTKFEIVKHGNAEVAASYKAIWVVKGECTNAIIVDNCNGTLTTTIKNSSFKLPGSGGMGTTLFTVLGVMLISAAGTMFVVYSRKRKSATR